MNVAIIPARGGSKRIPRKNIKEFIGKPIIAYSIEKAISSELFDKVIVSTDDDEIGEIAQQFGADVPFKRPSKLSDDFAGTAPVVAHAIKWLQNKGNDLNAICCVYSTAPLLDIEYLISGYEIFKAGNWNYVFSATEYIYPVDRSFKILDNGGLKMVFPKNLNKRSQDLKATFHDAGQFYWGTSEAWIKNRPIFSDKSTIIKLPMHRTADIDTEEDWERAELMYKIVENHKNFL